MRCVHPTCNSKSDSNTNNLAFLAVPKQSSVRTIWIKLLNIKCSSLGDDSAVCSKHFLPADLYTNRRGVFRIRAGALPIVDLQNNKQPESSIVKICRICFAADRKLYKMTEYNNLDQAYNIVTGLTLETEVNLPQYLCSECAQRLLNCTHFRSRSLRAHQILMEVVKKHKNITLQSLKAVIGPEGNLGSHLKIKQRNHFDLEINYNKEAPDEGTDEGIKLLPDVSVKMEKGDINYENIDQGHLPELHEHYDIKMDIDSVIQDDEDTKNFPMLNDDIVFKELIEEDDDETSDNVSVGVNDCHNDSEDIDSFKSYDYIEVKEECSNVEDDSCDNDTEVNDTVESVHVKKEDPLLVPRIPPKNKKIKDFPSKDYSELDLEKYRVLADRLIIIKPDSANVVNLRKRIHEEETKKEKKRRKKKKEHKTETIVYQTVNDIPPSGILTRDTKPDSCHCGFEATPKRVPSSDERVSEDQKKLLTDMHEKIDIKNKGNPGKLSCCICRERFKSNFELNVHNKIHSREKCAKTFNVDTNIELHARKLCPYMEKKVFKTKMTKKRTKKRK